MADIFIWQQEIWRKLTQNREFRGHALLLKGKKGIGKYEFARQLAKSLLCTEPTAAHKACGECLSCGWFEQSSHPNFYPVMPEALTINPGETGEKEESEEKSGSATTKKNRQSANRCRSDPQTDRFCLYDRASKRLQSYPDLSG